MLDLQLKEEGHKIFAAALKSPLFSGLSEADLKSVLACLSAKRRRYGRGAFIFTAGDRPREICVVLSGRVHLLKEDAWGNRNIISEALEGALLAESATCAGAEAFPADAVAVEETEALFLNYRRVLSVCTSACAFHTALIANMLRTLARQNIALLDKLEHLTRRSTRAKLLSYLYEQARLNGGRTFELPFNRQELADYLSVERSALSAELSKMRGAGLIDFRKNRFELLKSADS